MQPVIQLFCALAAVGLGALAPTTNISGTASAQEYPQRPVTLIIPVAAGTGADVIARVLAERLSERWGQQVLVINRPGGSGRDRRASRRQRPRPMGIRYIWFCRRPLRFLNPS